MPDQVKVIIARYTEDVSWADELGYDYVVYDKGGDCGNECMSLPNIGREAHSYFTHIVREYDQLADVNVFVQGDPFDHIDQHGGGDVEMLRSIIADVVDRGAPFRGFAWFRLNCDRLGRPHDLHDPKYQGRWAGWGKDIPVGEVYESLFGAPCPEKIIARGLTGNFAVTRDRIRVRPVSFYERALRMTEADPDDAGNTGHAFERLWQHIFNGSPTLNRSDDS